MEGEKCQRSRGHAFLQQAFHSQNFWERETLTLVPRGSNLLNATNKIDVLVLHFCLPTRRCLTHILNCSHWTSQRTLFSSLSSKFLFKGMKRERGNSSSNNWLSIRLGRTDVCKHDNTLFWHLPQLNSKNVPNKLLHGGFMNSFMKFFFLKKIRCHWFVCQRWRQHDFSKIHWRRKLNFHHS